MLRMYARLITLICLTCSFSVCTAEQKEPNHKESCVKETKTRPSWLYTGIYGGYGVTQGMLGSDGQSAQGRFALGAETPIKNYVVLGGEAGVQSGNQMRLKQSGTIPGGLPVLTTLKPFVDFLVTAKFPLMKEHPLSFVLKGGFAYQQLQLNDRVSSQGNLKKVNGEMHAGLCYQLSPCARIVAYYQGIYSKDSAEASVDSVRDVILRHIPTQQGGFMGIEFSL